MSVACVSLDFQPKVIAEEGINNKATATTKEFSILSLSFLLQKSIQIPTFGFYQVQ